MKCAHLFNGIGGFALAAHWMGWENLMHCEIDPFCNRVMNYHFPNSFQHEDIRTTDFRIWRGRIDLLTGGFPCQPASTAGKRSGKEDDRWLWPETKRAIVEIRPRIIVLENVNGLISLLEPASFTDVESQAVRFFNREHLLFKLEHKKRDKIEIGLKAIQERITAQIIKEIEAEGYLLPRTAKGIPIVLCIPACSVNAPHKRDRIWIVAYTAGNSRIDEFRNEEYESQPIPEKRFDESFTPSNTNNLLHAGGLDDRGNRGKATGGKGENEQQTEREENRQRVWDKPGASGEDVTNPECIGPQGQGGAIKSISEAPDRNWKASWTYDDGRWPTQSPVCGRTDGLPGQLVNITLPDWKRESIKSFGNAIVPAVAHQIFKAIEQYENTSPR